MGAKIDNGSQWGTVYGGVAFTTAIYTREPWAWDGTILAHAHCRIVHHKDKQRITLQRVMHCFY